MNIDHADLLEASGKYKEEECEINLKPAPLVKQQTVFLSAMSDLSSIAEKKHVTRQLAKNRLNTISTNF